MNTTSNRLFGFLFGWYHRRQERKLAQLQAEQARVRAEEKRARDAKNAERIRFYPLIEMKREELNKIPNGSLIDLNTCPIESWFVCTPSEFAPGVIVIGQVVPGLKLIADQWGSGMSLPERGINRYRVKFIN